MPIEHSSHKETSTTDHATNMKLGSEVEDRQGTMSIERLPRFTFLAVANPSGHEGRVAGRYFRIALPEEEPYMRLVHAQPFCLKDLSIPHRAEILWREAWRKKVSQLQVYRACAWRGSSRAEECPRKLRYGLTPPERPRSSQNNSLPKGNPAPKETRSIMKWLA